MRLIALGLAAWRLTSLLVNEVGPLAVFAQLRQAAGVKRDITGRAYALNPIGEMLACFWCASIWAALAALLIEAVSPRLNDLLAASALAIAWQRKVFDREQRRGANGSAQPAATHAARSS